MTLLAFAACGFATPCAWNNPGKDNPARPRPPMRRNSRRLTPSHNRVPGPGRCSWQEQGRQGGGEGAESTVVSQLLCGTTLRVVLCNAERRTTLQTETLPNRRYTTAKGPA